MLVNGLRKISDKYVGAVDNTIPYICKFSGPGTLTDALNGSKSNWDWESVSTNEAEDMDPLIVMFVKHIELNPHSNYRIIKNVFNMKDKNNRFSARVSISGILIDTTLYLKDKYKTENFDLMKLTTHDTITINRTSLKISVDDYYLIGRFDLRSCTYYCKW